MSNPTGRVPTEPGFYWASHYDSDSPEKNKWSVVEVVYLTEEDIDEDMLPGLYVAVNKDPVPYLIHASMFREWGARVERKSRSAEIYDVVMKLVGPIDPAGDASIDPDRLENLKALCDLTELFLVDINHIAVHNSHSHEHSVKKAGDYASQFLRDVKDE